MLLAVVGGGAAGRRRLGQGELRELLLERVRDDLVVGDRVVPVGGDALDFDLGRATAAATRSPNPIAGVEKDVVRVRVGGVIGGGGLRVVRAVGRSAAAAALEEVVEAPADDVRILLLPHDHRRRRRGTP